MSKFTLCDLLWLDIWAFKNKTKRQPTRIVIHPDTLDALLCDPYFNYTQGMELLTSELVDIDRWEIT